MVQLAAEPSNVAATKDIAAKAKIPSAYLAKVFQAMRRDGLIHARRGVGGVTLAKPANKITLLDVIEAVEPLKRQGGTKVASAVQLQKSIDAAVDQLRATFAAESLADVAPKGKKTTKQSVAKKR